MSEIPSRIRKIQKNEEVAVKIRSFIIQHNLKPGDRLPTEGEMAGQFGVSRVSVREAAKALGFLGIIDAAPRRGLTVGQVDVQRFSRYLSFHFALGDYSVDELAATRKIVETGCLEHVACQMKNNAELYTSLNEQNKKLRDLVGSNDFARWAEADLEFHYRLMAGSGLRFMMAFNELLQVFFQRLRETSSSSLWSLAVADHQGIIDSLRDGDVETAKKAMCVHVERFKAAV
ncbi:MAG: FCD domain-containing protein [Planctomycetota bacterium]|nr:FCD domain-containing protein [Planctomycetota bacterium]MDA1178907.1 FCD domain-containing protein [Planctomycetota bacterium]